VLSEKSAGCTRRDIIEPEERELTRKKSFPKFAETARFRWPASAEEDEDEGKGREDGDESEKRGSRRERKDEKSRKLRKIGRS